LIKITIDLKSFSRKQKLI